MRKYIFYGLYDPTGAGDEPLAVDFDKANLTAQQLEYEGYTKICEIDFDEFVDTMFYLGYSVMNEMHNLGKWLCENRVDYRERKGDIEVRRECGVLKYRGYWTDPDGKELHKDFDKIDGAEQFAIADRYSVIRDLQGGAFGMGRYYTVEEWREQALEWLDADDADEETMEFWRTRPAEEIIGAIEEWWQLEIVKCRDNGKN